MPNEKKKLKNGVMPLLVLLVHDSMIDQIMSADKSRLKSKIDELSDNDILSIENAMKRFFCLI